MIQFNNREFNCPMELAVHLISGKWKSVILWNLSSGSLRYGQICRRFPQATQKVLTAQLRDLEINGLIIREIFPEVPLRVEYTLSEFGRSLIPILQAMNVWGTTYFSHESLPVSP